jgi:hypothetical protein
MRMRQKIQHGTPFVPINIKAIQKTMDTAFMLQMVQLCYSLGEEGKAREILHYFITV